MSTELFCMWRTADNSGHTATLRSAQIRQSLTCMSTIRYLPSQNLGGKRKC